MLELRDIHTFYGLSHVLQGISLHVDRGEVLGLFGRNGVGKTTLIKAIAGWVVPSEGQYLFEGNSLLGVPSDQICRRGIGLVPEDRRIFPGLSVEENLVLGFMQTPGVGRAQQARKLEAIYQRFPRLAERRKQLGTTLSGGEQQMLAIARVLMGAPKLLLIDEPTEGLAPMIVDEIFDLIVSLRQDGVPIILVEQNVHRAIEVVTRFCVIERGKIVLEGRTGDPENREALFRQLAM
ncbi:MAG: ABC transporter ATP-binding protein [Burkholderiaceae bacterium]|jgi:branched-chain amino acid transport system ATP-binding protein|nr:ABC transporter ATP-binding protein [Burkholderiaceae bacterium]